MSAAEEYDDEPETNDFTDEEMSQIAQRSQGRPVGANDRGPMPIGGTLEKVIEEMRVRFTTPRTHCWDCKIQFDEPMPPPGRCAECEAKEQRHVDHLERTRITDLLASARQSIPDSFTGLTLDRKELLERCPNPSAIKKAWAAVAGAKSAVIIGESGLGKSTLAVAMLNEVLRMGGFGSSVGMQERAAKARFIAARHVAFEKQEETGRPSPRSLTEAATFASVLVLDDLGQELAGCPPGTPLAAMRITGACNIFNARYDSGKGIHIVTTPFTEEQVSSVYGGGVCRRIFERAVVIDLGKR